MKLLKGIGAIFFLPFLCAVGYILLYVVFADAAIEQMPSWAQESAEEWMRDIPQNSDFYPGEEEFYGIEIGWIPVGYTSVGWDGYEDENAGQIYGVPIADWGGPPPVGCNFGYEPNYTMLGQGVPHNGLDWTIPEGNKVVAVMGGKIVFANLNDGWGNLVVIENGDYQIWYGHLLQILVFQGEIVQHGDLVGLSGGETPPAGNSTGPHLHEGIKKRQGESYVWIDPAQFLLPSEWLDTPCR